MGRRLFNPGPTNTRESTKRALLTEDMSHRCSAFRDVFTGVRKSLVRLLDGDDEYEAVMFAASGTGANEAVARCLEGDTLVIVTGRYSERLAQILEVCGRRVHRMLVPVFAAVDCDEVAGRLRADPGIRNLAFVHHETTTGLLTPLRDLCALASRMGILTFVDAISSVGAHELSLNSTGPDYLTVTSNKGLEAFPGVSFVVARVALLEQVGPGDSYYFDIGRQLASQRRGEVPFTVPVQVVHALSEALGHLAHETGAGRRRRYALVADLMRRGLRSRGFELIDLPSGQQSNVVIPVRLPAGLDFHRLQSELEMLAIEIYSAEEALRSGYFFVASMGHLAHTDVADFLEALVGACGRQGIELVPGQHGGNGNSLADRVGARTSHGEKLR